MPGNKLSYDKLHHYIRASFESHKGRVPPSPHVLRMPNRNIPASTDTPAPRIPLFTRLTKYCLQKLQWILLICVALPITGAGPEMARAMITRLGVKITCKLFCLCSNMARRPFMKANIPFNCANVIGCLVTCTYKPIANKATYVAAQILDNQRALGFPCDITPLSHITFRSMAQHYIIIQIGALIRSCLLWATCLLPQVNLTPDELYDYFRLPPGALRALLLLTPGAAPVFPFLCTYMGCFCFYSGTLYLLALVYAYSAASLDVWKKEKKRLLSLGILHLLVAFSEYRERDHAARRVWIVYQLAFVIVHLIWTATENGGSRRLLD